MWKWTLENRWQTKTEELKKQKQKKSLLSEDVLNKFCFFFLFPASILLFTDVLFYVLRFTCTWGLHLFIFLLLEHICSYPNINLFFPMKTLFLQYAFSSPDIFHFPIFCTHFITHHPYVLMQGIFSNIYPQNQSTFLETFGCYSNLCLCVFFTCS